MRLAVRRPVAPRVARVALAAAVCGALAATAGCDGAAVADDEAPATSAARTSPGPTHVSAPGPTAAPGSDGIRSFVVVGDSLTAAGSRPLEELEDPGTGSWLGAAQGDPLDFRGGWAVPGATTADMLAGVEREDAEVVVLLAGTNDLVHGVPWETSADNLRDIVDAVGVDDVLVSAIPPLDSHPAEAVEYNRLLQGLADEEGWALVEPWTDVSSEGRFVPGASADGTHPTAEVADEAGRRIRAALLSGAGE